MLYLLRHVAVFLPPDQNTILRHTWHHSQMGTNTGEGRGDRCFYAIVIQLSKNLKIMMYRTIILPVVLYGCETWSLTLREKHRLRLVENRVLRKIFGRKTDEVTVEWRRLHSKKLHDRYCLPNTIRVIKSRRMKRAVHVARMAERRDADRFLVEKPEGKRPLWILERKWEDNIDTDLNNWGGEHGLD